MAWHLPVGERFAGDEGGRRTIWLSSRLVYMQQCDHNDQEQSTEGCADSQARGVCKPARQGRGRRSASRERSTQALALLLLQRWRWDLLWLLLDTRVGPPGQRVAAVATVDSNLTVAALMLRVLPHASDPGRRLIFFFPCGCAFLVTGLVPLCTCFITSAPL